MINAVLVDVIGDMSLAGAPIIGHYYAYKACHNLNKVVEKAV